MSNVVSLQQVLSGRDARELFEAHQQTIFRQTDRMFALLMAFQWLAGIAAAFWLSPETWEGATSRTHPHVWAALLLGGAISVLPILLAVTRPGAASTRYCIAVGQMLMSSLLIHITGGRIETHFHIFGSLAFLSFYRDWRVLIPATLVVAADHMLRGMFWPQSVFGVLTASNWRWLEHVGWVVFEDIFLIFASLRSRAEMWKIAERTAEHETAEEALRATQDKLEARVQERTAELVEANAELNAEIAERSQAEVALKESEERYRTVAETATDAIITIDEESQIVLANPAAGRIFGHTCEEMIGQSMRLLMPEKFWNMHQAGMRKYISTGQKKISWAGVEVPGLHRSGATIPLEVSFGEYRSGEKRQFTAFMRDITERKRAEAALAEAHQAAVETARLKSEFLANMSHEIRTPMNGVIGMTGLLLDTDLDPEQRDFVETIRASGDALLTVINDILDFSKLEAGKLVFETRDFDLRAVVESTAELLAEQAHSKGIELSAVVYSEAPTGLRGDPGRLRQVLTNVLGNAIKFTERGEVAVSVCLEVETDVHALLRFEVRDTGIGIPEETQHKLFQAFVQADGSTTRKYGGTGLGLAISRQLVEHMGGQIGVQSVEGEGATFTFTARFEKQSEGSNLPIIPRDRLEGLCALVVDDNGTNRKVLQHQLTSWGIRNDCASGGAEALEILRREALAGNPYDLTLLDMQMPEMNGLELARAIKHDPAISCTRLVMMTSLGRHGTGRELEETGIAACLTKPVRQSQLFDCLTSVLQDRGSAKVMENRHLDAMPSQPVNGEYHYVRILLAEDNPVNRKVTLRQLQRLGYKADTVVNGLEALAALERTPYDLVLMDCQMPEMDGYGATAELRRREAGAGRRIPVIAMTANALSGDREKCLDAGMDDYISKPVNTGDLEQLLARWRPSLDGATAADLLPPVDMERLLEVSGGDDDCLRELAALFLDQAAGQLQELRAAVEAVDASAVEHIAHTSAGGSSSCGMTRIVAPLRELERMGREGCLADSERMLSEAERALSQTGDFLGERVQGLFASSR